jgi:hypothetical protein
MSKESIFIVLINFFMSQTKGGKRKDTNTCKIKKKNKNFGFIGQKENEK